MAGEYLLNYKARKYYTGNGSQTDFLITFPGGNPIETSHVKVFVNGSELTSAWSVVGYGGNDYVRFQTPPNGASAGNVLLKRVTPDTEATRVVDFVGGSLLKAEDLDRSQLNCLYVSQESADLFLDQGGTAVNTTFDQSVGGVKTFTGGLNVANAANMIFKPSTIPINLIGGIQYVLAAKDSDGTVGWEETLLQRLPDNVVLTDGPVEGQDILTNKKFSGQVEFGNAVKITVGAATAKVLTSDGAGNASWDTAVNGVRLGSATNPIKTGIVTITAADIGVLGGVEVDAQGVSQVTGPVDFDGSITVGDAGLDNLVILASMKIPTNAGAGKVLTSNADGFCAWAVPTAYVTSVNGKSGSTTGGAVELTATDVGAVSVSTTQQITGAKTFTGNTVIGAAGGANTLDVLATLKYPVGLLTTGQAGRILTSTVNGTAYWASPPALGVVEINGITGSVIVLLPEDIGAVSRTINENIGGVKTFTSIPIMNVGVTINNTMKYAVGGFGVNKFLTSDASGNASWATVPASGIVSVNGDTGLTTGGAISISADSLGAVSKTTAQDITGVKSFKASVNLGDNPANQTITIGAPLYYPIGMGVAGPQEGQVLTSDASGKCVWQIPQAAGVTSLNGAKGVLTISADSLGALTEATLPVCDATTLGAVKMGSGLYMSGNGVLNVQTGGAFPIATRYDAATPTIGGFMVGDNLTINATTGRLDAMTGTGATQVTSLGGLTGSISAGALQSSPFNLASKAASQIFTNYNYYTRTIKLYKASNYSCGVNGGYGINLNCDTNSTDTTLHGCVSSQNEISTNDVYRGYSPTGGVTSHITGDGDAFFAGTVTATEGFVTPGGMSIGDNLIDGITLSGTLKIPAGAAAGYVLKCTADTDATTGALIGKAVWSNVTAAPVLSVNGIVGTVVITADGTNGLGAVTKDTEQTITGAKTFSAATILSNNCTIGTSSSNTLNVKAQLLLPNGAAVNKIWACNNATTGAGNWVNAPSGFVTSVNGHTPNGSGQVSVVASDIGAVTTTGDQNIAGAKTFTGTVNLSGNVIVGTTETTNITISSAIKIATGAVVGKYLTCANTDGSCQWSDAAQAPVSSVNGRVGVVVITADDATTGIGAVTKSTEQVITGKKTFSGVTLFTEAMTLGDGLADVITISGTMKIAQDAVQGKVLTCGATGGTVAWQSPLITSVITKIGTDITATQTGEVIIDAAKIGAATTAQLTTATTAIAAAQTTANNAATAAATAQSTANSKLAAVEITTTANPVGGTLLTCLSGNGTSTYPLKVEGALPIGGISAGDLTGSYPSPTIGLNKVSYAKMQTVAAQRLLGNATAGTTNVTEIQLGTGLTWAAGKLDTVNKGDAVLANNNSFTGSNGFGGTTTCEALTTTGAVILGNAAADTLTVNATPTFQTDVTLASGKVLITPAFRMNTSVTNGYVLTSDASGNGSWKASAASNVFNCTSAAITFSGPNGYTHTLTKVADNPLTISIARGATGSWGADSLLTCTGIAGQTWQGCVTGGGMSGGLVWQGFSNVFTMNGNTPVTTRLTHAAANPWAGIVVFNRTA